MENINLGENRTIDDQGIAALTESQESNTTLKTLKIYGNRNVSPRGWLLAFDRLRNCSSLEDLDVSSNNIDDEAMTSLASLCCNISTLHTLWIGDLRSITNIGWTSLSNALQHEQCMLKHISLFDIRVNDDMLSLFGNALAHNNRLEDILLDINEDSTISRRWTVLFNALCDTSSIYATFASNHTIRHICYENNDDHLPADIQSLLTLNRDCDSKFEAARMKILLHHMLDDGVNVDALVDMEVGVIPYAIDWIGKEDIGHPVLYKLCQSLPSLFECNKKVQGISALKRKR